VRAAEDRGRAVRKRSVTIAGHRTSISLEDGFWDALRDIAAEQKRSLQSLIREIDERRAATLSSAIRTYVLAHYRARARKSGLRKQAPGA
jgi:predicted DNA-binding ribbon-helix-helix protein